jgi:glyoxylase-like metal-dependent hydrolase (beta-lactamase superfamily II)
MELQKITDRVWLIPGSVNVGVVLLENSRVVLIDSGLDESHAEKIFELLSDYRFKVSHIFNTHAHADHIGGNHFFQQRTACRILAPELEAPMIRQPLIQSAVLFAGAPISDLMNRFIMANPSNVASFEESEFEIEDISVKVIDLPGHSINQKGFYIDQVAFLADAVFPEYFFNKQRLPFIYDPFAQLETLENLRSLKAQFFVGGHFKAREAIGPMLETNLRSVSDALEFMRKTLKVPQPQDRIVKSFMDHFSLKKNNWEYFLYRATVNGYLSSLYKQGEAKFKVLDNLLIWYAI